MSSPFETGPLHLEFLSLSSARFAGVLAACDVSDFAELLEPERLLHVPLFFHNFPHVHHTDSGQPGSLVSWRRDISRMIPVRIRWNCCLELLVLMK